MPHMTGTQLIKEAVTQYPEMAVILATGYAEFPSGTNADVPRLRKPYSQADLAEALSKVG
jgi:YesN/AraC family two-component response regulator